MGTEGISLQSEMVVSQAVNLPHTMPGILLAVM